MRIRFDSLNPGDFLIVALTLTLSACVAASDDDMAGGTNAADTFTAPTVAPPYAGGFGIGCSEGALGVFEVAAGRAAGLAAERAIQVNVSQQLAQAALRYAATDSMIAYGAAEVTAAGAAGATAYAAAASAGVAVIVVAGIYVYREHLRQENCKRRLVRALVSGYIAAFGKRVFEYAVRQQITNEIFQAVSTENSYSAPDIGTRTYYTCPSVDAGGLTPLDNPVARGQGTPTTSGGWNMCSYDYLPLNLVNYHLANNCEFTFTTTQRNAGAICFTRRLSRGQVNQTGVVPNGDPTDRFAFTYGGVPDSWPIGPYPLSMGQTPNGNFYQRPYPYTYGEDNPPGRLVGDLATITNAYGLSLGRGWDFNQDIWDENNALTRDLRSIVQFIE